MSKEAKWYDWATCKDSGLGQPDSKHQALDFMEKFCSVCPVTYECEKSAQEADLYWNVMAGKMPVRFISNTSAPSVRDDWKPKPAPAVPSPGTSMLERGICNKGSHGIESRDDLKNYACRACYNFRWSLEGRRQAALRPPAVKRAKPTDTHCKNGHERNEANAKKSVYVHKSGRTVEAWVCMKCSTDAKNSAISLQRQKTHCPRGHEYNEENTLRVKRKGGGVNRVCRACRRKGGRHPVSS